MHLHTGSKTERLQFSFCPGPGWHIDRDLSLSGTPKTHLGASSEHARSSNNAALPMRKLANDHDSGTSGSGKVEDRTTSPYKKFRLQRQYSR